ncbi:MAG: hypothetical protein PHR35_18795 [Kiritimatiellae bacterium]|nr:hypothetical protein [Kiritimatiellia bacterium]
MNERNSTTAATVQLLVKAFILLILLHASWTTISLLLEAFPSLSTDPGTRLFLRFLPALIILAGWYLRAVGRVRNRAEAFQLQFLGYESNFHVGRASIFGLVLGLADSLLTAAWWPALPVGLAIVVLLATRHDRQ